MSSISHVRPTPLIQSIPYKPESYDYFACFEGLMHRVWLDSGPLQQPRDPSITEQAHLESRFDIISACPSTLVNAQYFDEIEQDLAQKLLCDNELKQLIEALNDEQKQLPFLGGWLGYIGYEARHSSYKIKNKQAQALELAPSQFGWYDWALIQDHQQQRSYFVTLTSLDSSLLAELKARIDSVGNTDNKTQQAKLTFNCSEFESNTTREDYNEKIAQVHQYILNGDCYQVNFTRRFSASFEGSAEAAYLKLRQTVPSPFCAFIELADGQNILSISPERFIKIEADQALSQPIKGTAPRSLDAKQDSLLSSELLASRKNRAENLMIVDLLRNDFSQHCQPHSVITSKLFELQSFANVHHLVSSIHGQLKDTIDHPKFIASCFPGGSITGAPKKRAMEIIDELESHQRGPYCGCIGYFSLHGKSDFNIAIRTLYQEHDSIYCWSGGGIVMDSNAEEEFLESEQKVGGLLKALS